MVARASFCATKLREMTPGRAEIATPAVTAASQIEFEGDHRSEYFLKKGKKNIHIAKLDI